LLSSNITMSSVALTVNEVERSSVEVVPPTSSPRRRAKMLGVHYLRVDTPPGVVHAQRTSNTPLHYSICTSRCIHHLFGHLEYSHSRLASRHKDTMVCHPVFFARSHVPALRCRWWVAAAQRKQQRRPRQRRQTTFPCCALVSPLRTSLLVLDVATPAHARYRS
jgi:hypothetical protein